VRSNYHALTLPLAKRGGGPGEARRTHSIATNVGFPALVGFLQWRIKSVCSNFFLDSIITSTVRIFVEFGFMVHTSSSGSRKKKSLLLIGNPQICHPSVQVSLVVGWRHKLELDWDVMR
jgi:hypothetical protein